MNFDADYTNDHYGLLYGIILMLVQSVHQIVRELYEGKRKDFNFQTIYTAVVIGILIWFMNEAFV